MTPDLPREFNADAAVNDLIALVGAVDGLTNMTTPAQIARIQGRWRRSAPPTLYIEESP